MTTIHDDLHDEDHDEAEADPTALLELWQRHVAGESIEALALGAGVSPRSIGACFGVLAQMIDHGFSAPGIQPGAIHDVLLGRGWPVDPELALIAAYSEAHGIPDPAVVEREKGAPAAEERAAAHLSRFLHAIIHGDAVG